MSNKYKNLDILEDYIMRINTHDFKQVNEILTKKSLFIFTDQICSTPNEIQNYFENAWIEIRDEVYAANEVRLLFEDNHTKVYTYIYEYSGYDCNDQYVKGKGKATNVFCKIDGSWKLVHEHLSSF
ncbi:DUF4440 domain-containing protein [Enterococcus faecium]|uniref:YybH family protein n=1 Tax=Enterococcus faecium TaxID=1352 RepID=UPI000CF20C65|nr:nuclear transport factor 2 family protein [Enterococcus faecium]EGP4915547.1 nuclear transport factor 2 family protein [Enterococcus faecium]EGP5745430.1 DUF4440 domain-containing protein [Enterococcus faecium]EME3504437.1 nuclear transport factor 2 family protein [Enterococcus faecium]EMF0331735.1 nuclear transport factor 2 family protein [Enterococcus faecium]EMF0451016.1 nuclear transport factor 2 family protein [Enterococcus faecium]